MATLMRIFTVATAAVLASALCGPARSAERLALVVGNGGYDPTNIPQFALGLERGDRRLISPGSCQVHPEFHWSLAGGRKTEFPAEAVASLAVREPEPELWRRREQPVERRDAVPESGIEAGCFLAPVREVKPLQGGSSSRASPTTRCWPPIAQSTATPART